MVDIKAQLAENLKIVFGKSKKGGYQDYRLTHENLTAYIDTYGMYHASDSPEYKNYVAKDLDESDYFFTLKTKLWLVSLCEDERKDVKPILDQLNNQVFWDNLFNWRRMEKLSSESSSKQGT